MLKWKQFFLLIVVALFSFSFTLSQSDQNSDDLQISYCKMVYSVTAHEDLADVSFVTHTSIITDDSIPLFIKIPEENNFCLKTRDFSFKTIKGDNKLIRFNLKNCAREVKNYIAFEVYTLKRVSDYNDMPEEMYLSAYSNLSEEIRYFSNPSFIVQSDDPQIKAKASEFLFGSWNVGNVIEILEQIMKFTHRDIEYKGNMPQDARSVLTLGYGVCTGKANLAAALCRALGIPARVLFVLSHHYIVDVYLPDYGWVRGESTMGRFPYPKNNWTIQWIVDIDDENYAIDKWGVPAYFGLEDNVNANWEVEPNYRERIEDFAMVDGEASLNEVLFDKGKELWRLFCQLKNSGLSHEQLIVFSGYHQLYLESLLSNDIEGALDCADLAISEAKRLMNL